DLCAQSPSDQDVSRQLWRAAQDRPCGCVSDCRAHPLRAPTALAVPARRALRPTPALDALSLPSGAEPGAREELLPELPVSDLFDLRPDRAVWRPVRSHQQCGLG